MPLDINRAMNFTLNFSIYNRIGLQPNMRIEA